MFPLQIARNAVGKTVSIDLINGECINGTVSRSDMMMNIVLRNAIRSGSTGEAFWSAKEALVRGTSIVSIRLDPEALVPSAYHAARSRGARGGDGARGGRGGRGRGSAASPVEGDRERGRGRGRGRGGSRGARGGGGRGTDGNRGRGGAKRPRES